MTIKFELKQPTYKIVPTFKTIGRGKSKKKVLERINCSITFHKSLIVNGVITKNDIDKTIPQLEKFGVDFYSEFVNACISELIIQINDMFDTQLIHKDFDEKYQDVFIEFINELKTMINENMKYKVGDKVRIKSLDWYNENKDEYGYVNCPYFTFFEIMSQYCGKTLTITSVDKFDKKYKMKEDGGKYCWTDKMIEGLSEEETSFDFKVNEFEDAYEEITNRAFKGGYQKCLTDIEINGYELPNGYIFKDDKGNVINATKIVLEKKKKEYPKTYEECCEIVKVGKEHTLEGITIRINYKIALLESFQKLLICRDAYWKIAGEEMGLNRPWEPQGTNTFSIFYDRLTGEIEKQDGYCWANSTLEFPTEEMRDAFKENFKKEIEICKELL